VAVIIVVGVVTIVGGRQYIGGSKGKVKPNPAPPSRAVSAMQDMAVGSDDDELFGDEDSVEETEKKLEKLLSDSVVGKVREVTRVRPKKAVESQRSVRGDISEGRRI